MELRGMGIFLEGNLNELRRKIGGDGRGSVRFLYDFSLSVEEMKTRGLSLLFAFFAKNLCVLAFFYRKGAKDNRKGRKIRVRVFVSSCLYLIFFDAICHTPKILPDACNSKIFSTFAL